MTSDKIIDQYLNSRNLRILREEIEKEMLMNEVANTIPAGINEILVGFYALGGSWKNFQNAQVAQTALEQRKKQVSPEEYRDQDNRAKVMAEESIKWANQHNFDGNPVAVWWTAKPNELSRAVGYPVDSRKNPTDILLKFSNNTFLGISAKSTKRSGDISFKNPGLGSLGKFLDVDFNSYINKIFGNAVKKYNLPLKNNERVEYIRSKPEIQNKTREIGGQILSTLRNSLFNVYKKKFNKDQVTKHIKSVWIDAEESMPPYIKVTGHSKNGNYSATVMNPIDNSKLLALATGKVSMTPVGQASILVSAGKTKIMKIRWKWKDEPLASSIKLSGDPVGGIHEGQISEDLIPITIDFAEARKNILNEDWGLMFGSWIKTLLGGLFQGLDIPATIKGTKSEVDSFAKTLNREKKYIESWRKYGLDNPATYRDKAKLQGSIKDFERTTNIKWPFKD